MSIIKTFSVGLGDTKSVLVDLSSQPRQVEELKKLSTTSMVLVKTSTTNTTLTLAAPQPLAHVSIDNKPVAQPIKDVVQAVIKQDVKVKQNPSPQLNLNPYSVVAAKDLSPSIDFGSNAKRSTDYELDTGLSEIRPQVIAVTQFLPLFQDSKNNIETIAGSYYRAEVFNRNLKQSNILRAVTIADQTKINTKDGDLNNSVKSGLLAAKLRNANAIKSLKNLADTFLSLTFDIENLKSKLDVRDDQKSSDVQKAIDDYIKNYASQRSLEAFVLSTHPDQYDITDVLSSLGYDKNNIEHVFSATKVWLQLAYEAKLMLKTHSLNLIDSKSIDAIADNNPVTITKNKTIRFDFNQHQPNIIFLNVLKDIQPNNVNDSIDIIENAYRNLYSAVTFLTDEAKICSMLNLVTKENRYSYAFSQQNVKNILSNYYGYSSNETGNTQFFDAVFGQFGDSIADILANNPQSVAVVAQQFVDSTAVLTFENKHVVGNGGELAPGSLFYVDMLLRIDSNNNFNTTNLQKITDVFQKTTNSLSLITNAANLIIDDPQPTDMASISDLSIVSNPKLLFNKIASSLVDSNGKSLPLVTNDAVASIFRIAASNDRIKSLLFIYFIAKISRTNTSSVPFFSAGLGADNITTIQAVIEQLIKELDTFLKNYQTTKTVNAPDIVAGVTINSIKSMFLNSSTSGLINFVSDLLKMQITLMQKDNSISFNGVTRYGAHADTIFMMAFFDCVLTIINAVSKQEFLGRDTDASKGERYLYFQQLTTSKTTKNRLNAVKSKLNNEIALIQQAVFSMLGTMSNLSTASQNLLNSVQSAQIKSKLSQLISILPDKKLIKYFLTKQQIMLFAYRMSSITNRISEQTDSSIAFFDENYVSQKEQAVIRQFFNNDQFFKNKNILSVGIPIGFVDKLQQSIDVKTTLDKTSFNAKQNDIINVCVYKIDAENPHIIFKPRKFLIETSRLSAVGDKAIRNSPRAAEALATFNLSDYSSQNNNFEFFPSLGVNQEKTAFSDETYSFLSTAQKTEIHTNTVTSYMLEKYISILTGLMLSNNSFSMSNVKLKMNEILVKQIIDAEISGIVQRKNAIETNFIKTGVLFPASPSGNKNQGIDTLITDPIEQIVRQDINTAVSMLVTANDMTSLASTLSDGSLLQSKLICPQKFDRVFHCLVETNDFIIDQDVTCSSELGKTALNNLLSNQTIEQINVDGKLELRFKEKFKSNSVVFDKHFVTVEMLDTGIVS